MQFPNRENTVQSCHLDIQDQDIRLIFLVNIRQLAGILGNSDIDSFFHVVKLVGNHNAQCVQCNAFIIGKHNFIHVFTPLCLHSDILHFSDGIGKR